jgi:hypothetical protein
MYCHFCSKEAKYYCDHCISQYYCSYECQKNDWKNHKKICKKKNIDTKAFWSCKHIGEKYIRYFLRWKDKVKNLGLIYEYKTLYFIDLDKGDNIVTKEFDDEIENVFIIDKQILIINFYGKIEVYDLDYLEMENPFVSIYKFNGDAFIYHDYINDERFHIPSVKKLINSFSWKSYLIVCFNQSIYKYDFELKKFEIFKEFNKKRIEKASLVNNKYLILQLNNGNTQIINLFDDDDVREITKVGKVFYFYDKFFLINHFSIYTYDFKKNKESQMMILNHDILSSVQNKYYDSFLIKTDNENIPFIVIYYSDLKSNIYVYFPDYYDRGSWTEFKYCDRFFELNNKLWFRFDKKLMFFSNFFVNYYKTKYNDKIGKLKKQKYDIQTEIDILLQLKKKKDKPLILYLQQRIKEIEDEIMRSKTKKIEIYKQPQTFPYTYGFTIRYIKNL